jgi:hypothetical protein
MKLAEALLLRADMQTRLTNLQDRIKASAVVQKGDKPLEDPQKLLREAVGVMAQLQEIICKINEANLAAKLPDGRSLTAAIAERDTLKRHHALLMAADDAMRRTPDRHGSREIKWVPQFDSAKLQKQAEDVSGKIRTLNAKIQEANWRLELP